MNEVMARACCTSGPSLSGANQSATRTSTVSIRPMKTRQSIPSLTSSTGIAAACIPVVISLRKDLAPLCFHRAAHLGAGFGDRRKLVDPFVGPARVDDHARAATLLIALTDHG